MNTITIPVQSFRTLDDILKQARRANLLLQLENGEQYVVAKISSTQSFYVGDSDDFGEEVKTTRSNKTLMKFLDERGAEARRRKLVSMDEVEKRLGLKKRGKKRKG